MQISVDYVELKPIKRYNNFKFIPARMYASM